MKGRTLRAPPSLSGVKRGRLRLACGLELALLEWPGAGPPLLLHHANGFCAGVWGLVAAELAGSFRVFAYDARGHGDSDKPPGPESYRWGRFVDDLLEFASALLRRLGVSKLAAGVGHSFGGTAMLAAASRAPELFNRLVLVDPVVPPPSSLPPDPERARRLQALVRGARARRSVWPSREAARARWARRKLFARCRDEALDLYVTEGLRERPDGSFELKCPPEVEASIFEGSGVLDLFSLAPRVRCPVHILWAKRGDFPRSLYEGLAARLPRATIHDVDSGHLVPMEAPEAVAALVRRVASPAACKGSRGAAIPVPRADEPSARGPR